MVLEKERAKTYKREEKRKEEEEEEEKKRKEERRKGKRRSQVWNYEYLYGNYGCMELSMVLYGTMNNCMETMCVCMEV